MLSFSGLNVRAEEDIPIVSSSRINTETSDEQLITVNISGNNGIMGFKLHFEYDSAKVEITEVNKGAVTSSGMMNDNINAKENCFDLLWNSTKNAYGDGSIAVVNLKSLTNEAYKINVSYSIPDTFNESWEDVKIICYPICTDNFDFEALKEETMENVELTDLNEYTADSAEITNVQTEIIISDVLEDMPIENLDKLSSDDKAHILNTVNSQISAAFDRREYYSDYDKLVNDYKERLSDKLKEDVQTLDTEKSAETIIKEFLDENNYSEVTEKNAAELNDCFSDKGLDMVYEKYLDNGELAKAYSELYSSESDEIGYNAPLGFVVMATVICGAVIAVLIFFIIKRRKYKNEAEK